MGAGHKEFITGTLTSGDVNGYLMHQSVMCFTDAAERDSALSGWVEDGMIAYLEDVNAYYFYDGTISLPAAGVAGWRPWFSQWGAYTPAWTNLSVGDGTVVAAFRWEFGSLHFRGQITFGGTTSISGTVSMALPDSRQGDGYSSIGKAIILDTGTRLYLAEGHIPPNGYDVNFVHSDGGVINATSPMTWATGDVLGWDMIANPMVAG